MSFYIYITLFLFVSSIIANGNKLTISNRTYQSNEKIYVIIAFGTLCTFTALRRIDVGNDTYSYYKLFQYYSQSSFNDYSQEALGWMNDSIEVGWQFFNKIMYKFTDNYQSLIIVVSIFSYTIVCLFIYKISNNLTVSTLLFFFLSYSSYINIQRQVVAVSIVLIGIVKLMHGKKAWFLALCLIAALFHSSAIFCISFLIFYSKKRTKKLAIVLILCAIVCTILHIPRQLLLYVGYSGQYLRWQAGLSNYFYLLINAFMFASCQYLKSDNDENSIMPKSIENLFDWLPLIALVISILNFDLPILVRFLYYIYVLYCVSFPLMLSKSLKSYSDKNIICFSLIMIMFIYKLGIILYRPDWVTEYQYHFYWT